MSKIEVLEKIEIKDTYTYDQEEASDVSWAYNDERGLSIHMMH